MRFGEQLRVWRKANPAATQEKISSALGKSRTYAAGLESGDIRPPDEKGCAAIARVIGVPAETVWAAAAEERLRSYGDDLWRWHKKQVDAARRLDVSSHEQWLLSVLRIDGTPETPGLRDGLLATAIAEVIQKAFTPEEGPFGDELESRMSRNEMIESVMAIAFGLVLQPSGIIHGLMHLVFSMMRPAADPTASVRLMQSLSRAMSGEIAEQFPHDLRAAEVSSSPIAAVQRLRRASRRVVSLEAGAQRARERLSVLEERLERGRAVGRVSKGHSYHILPSESFDDLLQNGAQVVPRERDVAQARMELDELEERLQQAREELDQARRWLKVIRVEVGSGEAGPASSPEG